MMHERSLGPRLRQLAERDIADDSVDLWPVVHLRAAHSRRRTRFGGWQLAVAAAIVAVLVMPGYSWLMTASEANAAEILGSAAAATAGAPGGRVSTYHLRATRTALESRGQPNTTQLEVWFGGNGHFREEIHDPDHKTVVATDGGQAWVSLTTPTGSYAARSVDLSTERSLVAPGYADLAQLLAGLSRKACGTATHTGDGTVAGRPAYVISVTGQCVDDKRRINAPAQTPPVASTFWIDKETYLPLRSEEKTANGTVRYEVSLVEYNVALAPALFQFSPTSGARVFERAQDLKTAVAGAVTEKPGPRPSP